MNVRIIVLILAGFLLSFGACSTPGLLSEFNMDGFVTADSVPGFQPEERVVLLGNSLFENDLDHGWLEYGLITGWAEYQLTVRNLGWSGDTVYGESRGTYTRPPDSWGHLAGQLEDAEPDIVWIAYGGVEMAEGEAGLERFNSGVNRLLDKVQELGARVVLISPLPYLSRRGLYEPEPPAYENLDLYSRTLSEIAAARQIPWLDLRTPLRAASRELEVSDNGIHLNENGYIQLTCLILAGSNRPISPVLQGKGGFCFRNGDTPHELSGNVSNGSGTGQGSVHAGATGVDDSGSDSLRSLIVEKNRLYFQYYRPINRTYLTGFRAYEQGNNAPELEQFRELAEELDREIKEYLKTGFGQ
ncbi:MAG: GDSL-type esterase/lipase family protein [Balneolaceae bacterium]